MDLQAYTYRNEEIVIIDADAIERKNICDCQDGHGNRYGCIDAGCAVKEFRPAFTPDSDNLGEIGEHTVKDVFEWFDGSNWQFITVNDEYIPDEYQLKIHDDSDKIVAEFLMIRDDLESLDGFNTTRSFESENYIFSQKPTDQSEFALATAEIK